MSATSGSASKERGSIDGRPFARGEVWLVGEGSVVRAESRVALPADVRTVIQEPRCPKQLRTTQAREDVQYSTFVRERIERGRREAAGKGKVMDEAEVELRMKEWLDD